jgi:Endoribonuclease L-PSP
MPREVISTPAAPEYPSYSQAVKVGNTIYVAGTIGVDVTTGEMAGPTIQEQTCPRPHSRTDRASGTRSGFGLALKAALGSQRGAQRSGDRTDHQQEPHDAAHEVPL